MPNVLLSESMAVELGSSEQWPDDVRLFEPFEFEQILLPEVATVRSVQAFLRMCSLKFSVDQRANAEQMSPSGGIPFMKCGSFVISEMEPIVSFVNAKGINLSEHLDASQKADMKAYMSLVNNVLYSAELYLTWCHDDTYNTSTYQRYSFAMPFPLNMILTWRKRRTVFNVRTNITTQNKFYNNVYGFRNSIRFHGVTKQWMTCTKKWTRVVRHWLND